MIIRVGAVQMLDDAGYITLDASNAYDAIQILERRNDIRAVFTDITMSGSMDGLKLAHTIRVRWPPIHLVVTSGLRLITQDQLPAKARFIPKPYDSGQVISVFQELFAAA